eukprot:TRINITY_DN27708_c0_g1_i1.p1 TRINITY_DN27708_c0_g1~~TRINITY_DN27708_c0_g1_i1.p1  ORF type:complete len:372 (+),score=59.10 TRINITY_DN27708_c0_g1_i1:34-1149(+)
MELFGTVNPSAKEVIWASLKDAGTHFDNLQNATSLTKEEICSKLGMEEVPNKVMSRSLFSAVSFCLSRHVALTSHIVARVVTAIMKETDFSALPPALPATVFAAGILDGSIQPSHNLLQVLSTSLKLRIVFLCNPIKIYNPGSKTSSPTTIFLSPGLAGTYLSVVGKTDKDVVWETSDIKKLEGDGAEMLSDTKDFLDSQKRVLQKRRSDIEEVRKLLKPLKEPAPLSNWMNPIDGELKARPLGIVDRETNVIELQEYPSFLQNARLLLWKSLWDSRPIRLFLWGNWPSIKLYTLTLPSYADWQRGLSDWEQHPRTTVCGQVREIRMKTVQPGQTVVLPALPSPLFKDVGIGVPVYVAYHFINNSDTSNLL